MLFANKEAHHYAGPRSFLEDQCQPYTSKLHSHKRTPRIKPPRNEGVAVQQRQDLLLICPFSRPAQVLKKLCAESKHQVTGLTKLV